MEQRLVPGVCTQCQSVLQLNPEHDAAVCPSCGTPFIIDKAITQYNIMAQGTLNISNSVIQMGPSVENLIKRGYQFIESNQYDKASEYFNQALDIDLNCQEAKDGLAKLKELQRIKQNNAIFQNAKREESLFHYCHAYECYMELHRREPDNPEYAEALTRTYERVQNFAYIAEPLFYLGTVFPTPGVFFVTTQKIFFVPRDAGKKDFSISIKDYVSVNAASESSKDNAQLVLLKLFYKKDGLTKNCYFRTEKASEIAQRIQTYMQNGFD